ncbi:hypothetical protein HK102_006205 [Quaeritorhiza haematococci]|nr:hypothetical protein HK102_006205 [Quaeritorhiza haematococci]
MFHHKGITFQEFACLARCNGLKVIAKRGDQVSKEEFESDLRDVVSSLDKHMVVSFSRKTLGQTGDGHFSPIGAYHPGANRVLVLDTARFKYPAYFAPFDLLYEAMQPIDKQTGLPRGYFLIEKGGPQTVPLCKLTSDKLNWPSFTKILCCEIPEKLSKLCTSIPSSSSTSTPSSPSIQTPTISTMPDVEDVVRCVLSCLLEKDYQADIAAAATITTTTPKIKTNPSLLLFISFQDPGVDLAGGIDSAKGLARGHAEDVHKLIQECTGHPLFDVVRRALTSLKGSSPSSSGEPTTEDIALATIFLLATPREIYAKLPQELYRRFEDLRGNRYVGRERGMGSQGNRAMGMERETSGNDDDDIITFT